MKEVGRNLFLGILLLIFLSSGVFADMEYGKCGIVLRNSCLAINNDSVVMGLSATTNAHAEVPTVGSYPYVLCCDLGTGIKTCSGTNEIVGLSATTNAHAEVPYGPYSFPICYEDFICEKITGSCLASKPLGILSLSATTNAHVGTFDTYSTKICCGGSSITNSLCKIKSATWSVTNAIEGQSVRLVVTGSGAECNGRNIYFVVRETDGGTNTQAVETNPINVAFNGATATGMWFAEYQDDGFLGGDPEYIFTATLDRNSKISMTSTNQLSVSRDLEFCTSVATCDDYNNQLQCESDASLCNVASYSSLPEVDCNADSTVCGCLWDSSTSKCEFGWGEIEDYGDPNIPIENGGGCNYGTTLCKNSSGNYCNLGSTCPSGESPTSNNNGTCDFGEGCLSADCKGGDQDTCKQGFYCISTECSTVESPLILSLLGSCKVTQDIEKSCEEEPVGYKIITWTGVWTGSSTGSAAYQRCIAGGRTTVPCAAQVQLPFFDYIELIATLVVLAIIYTALLYKKKHHHKKKK
jgi:hypothetical protein